jgi:hypothetical protein
MVSSRSKKQSAVRKTRKNTKNMATRKNKSSKSKTLSVSDIRGRFSEMDKNMRDFIKRNNLNNPSALTKQVSRHWSKLFNKHLSTKAANTLANHYANLHGKKKGGSHGAPLDYVMRPGMPGVTTYGVFPTEAGADPKSVSHLDVYYNSALGRSCGLENTTAQVPKDMGSNHVVPAKGGRRKTRRVKGGDFMTTMGTRLFVAESASNPFQRIAESTMGQAPFVRDNADPTAHGWGTVSDKATPLMTPMDISVVDKDITRLAAPSPYPAVKG